MMQGLSDLSGDIQLEPDVAASCARRGAAGRGPALRARLLAVGSLVAAAACTLTAIPAAAQDNPAQAKCEALANAAIDRAHIALPSSGAQINQAQYVTAAGKPAYCMVKGQIQPVDPAAPPILFQVNMPIQWNDKFVQYGGGGLNGTLISGLDALRDAPPGPTPVERGYATAGTDGGHPVAKEIQAFALNDEALMNHAYGAYKKTHDVALALLKLFYAHAPKRAYFYGGSEGGREALSGAQRFPADYDGIVSTVPILSWTGVNLYEYQIMLDHQAGGYMVPDKVKLWQETTLATCDRNDGIADGIVADYRRCNAKAAFARLRCADGKDLAARCFSDAQLTLIERARNPFSYGIALAHGERSSPAFGLGGEATPSNVIPMIVDAPDKRTDALGRPRYPSGDVRYFIFQDAAKGGPVDLARYGDRIRQISALMDMNDPDLARFAARGGKLIMKANTADYLVPPGSVWRYYENVVRRMGKAKAENVIRLYVAPGTGHFGGGTAADGQPVPDRIDLLAALDRWVEAGTAMEAPVLTSYDKAGRAVASWPFCRYPQYPHYLGKGDPKAAASYQCRSAH